MKHLIPALCFIAFLASCSSGPEKPCDCVVLMEQEADGTEVSDSDREKCEEILRDVKPEDFKDCKPSE